MKRKNLNSLSAGDFVEKITHDAHVLIMIAYTGNVIWTGPLQILFVLIYIYWGFGLMSLFGFLFVFPLFFIQLYFSKKESKTRSLKYLQQAKRVKLINELLSGIRAVKMFCWEKPFKNLIDSIREKENYFLWKKFFLQSMTFELDFFASKFIVALCIIVYSYFGNELRTDKIFPLMLLINYIVIVILKRLPSAFKDVWQCLNILNKMEDFLLLDLKSKESIKNSKHPFQYGKQKGQGKKQRTKFNKSVICLKGANASWDCVSLLSLTRPKLNSNQYLVNFSRHPPLKISI